MEGVQYATARVYEEIEPSEEWAREEAYDTLIVYLPGFRKENLKIQVTSARNIRVLGERPVGHDTKWQRFRKEYPIPSNCDTNDISARFESGLLYVKLPKTITPEVEILPPKTPTQAPKPQPTEAPKAPTQAPKPPKEAPKLPPTEAPKAATQAPMPPKEAPKPPPTEAPKTQKPISNYYDNQEQNKKINGSQESWKSSDFGSPRTTENFQKEWEKERETIAAPIAQKPVEKEKKSTKITEKVEENIGKKAEDSTREEYKRAIFGVGDEKTNGGFADKFCRPEQGYNYRQGVGGLVMGMKQQPRKLVNLGLAVLFILVLGWYVKSAYNSFQEFSREEL